MNNIDKDKYIKLIRDKNKGNNGSRGKKFLMKTFILIILFLSLAIMCKSSSTFKTKVYEVIGMDSVSFVKFKNIYNKYLGGIFPLHEEVSTEKVFSEKLKYNESSKYLEGVLLSVGDNYLVPSLKEGMVVFIGEKEGYNKTIIIESLDGVHYWYGNIDSTSLKLYDYIEEGSYVGEVNNELYMVFSRDNKFLNYEEYIK